MKTIFIPALLLTCFVYFSCSGNDKPIVPDSDFLPPTMLAAVPKDSRILIIDFDETIQHIQGSETMDPYIPGTILVEGARLTLQLSEDQEPGKNYSFSGEVKDARGNRTRYVIRFSGYNARAPKLIINEVQTSKNTSVTKPHRDFVELIADADGNLGGMALVWSSTVKTYSFTFPGAEVKKGDYIVIHLSPEGLDIEKNELGIDLALSGGIDATPNARDFWSAAGGIPDASGAIGIRRRPDGPFDEGLFYGDQDKTGNLSEDKLSAMVMSLIEAGAWEQQGDNLSWEDSFRWNPSTSRTICRKTLAVGSINWVISASSAQSPGLPNF